MKQSNRSRNAPLVLMALLAACAAGMSCGEQALEDGTGLEDSDIQLDPIPDEINCTVVESDGEPSSGVTLVCQDGDGQQKQQQIDCLNILTIVVQGSVINKCLANCNPCKLSARQRARYDTALDTKCGNICAKGTCPPGKDCVLDKVASKTEVPTCLKGAIACTTPTKPDYCFSIEVTGECICKCV